MQAARRRIWPIRSPQLLVHSQITCHFAQPPRISTLAVWRAWAPTSGSERWPRLAIPPKALPPKALVRGAKRRPCRRRPCKGKAPPQAL